MRRTRPAAVILLAVLLAAGCASDTAGHGGTGDPTGRVADQIRIVAIALGGGGARGDSQVRAFVNDHYCRIIDRDRRGPCPVRPIPAAVQRGVLTVVGDEYRFVSRTPRPSLKQPVVALGAPVIRGDTATIALDSQCGPLCGSGVRIHLHRDAGRWHEVGQRETDWIS
jgi:hypothetical protein